VPTVPEGAAVRITGGFGGIGLTLAAHLIERQGARVALLARRSLPPRADWPRIPQTAAPNDATAARIRAVEAREAMGWQVLCLAADVCKVEG
jgi:NAD(P)-dependent dehydrogenase (short-subunit alcohol dehydrogenase family)